MIKNKKQSWRKNGVSYLVSAIVLGMFYWYTIYLFFRTFEVGQSPFSGLISGQYLVGSMFFAILSWQVGRLFIKQAQKVGYKLGKDSRSQIIYFFPVIAGLILGAYIQSNFG